MLDMQANTHTERRYWHLARRRNPGQPWAAQNDRTGRLVWAPVVAIDLDDLFGEATL